MESNKHFLCSFKPICRTRLGRKAIDLHGYPPYIDGSCRREPDLENKAPSISALCRLDKFAPRLNPGDGVVYIGTKARYPSTEGTRWPLVAVLRVIKRFDDHGAAAEWYRSKGFNLPRNCMVDGNLPLDLDHTSGPKDWGCFDESQPGRVISRWNAMYKGRAKECGIFLACTALCLCLHSPLMLDNNRMIEIMKEIPGTQNPPEITPAQFDSFLTAALSASLL